MSTKRILLYGLQRTGTNYLRELIQQQFDAEFVNKLYIRNHPAHKHFRIYDDKSLIARANYRNNLQFPNFSDFEHHLSLFGHLEADCFLIISKDPYSWNQSYTKWGNQHKWTTSINSNIHEYIAFYRKWLDFAGESSKVRHIRYLDLLTEKEAVLNEVASTFDLIPRENLKLNDLKKVPYSQRFTKRRLRFYLKEEYLASYKRQELEEINGLLDQQLISALGYDMVKIRNE